MRQVLELVGVLTAATLASCMLGVSESARNARLPIGVTLLDSDQEQCAGAVQLEESISDRELRTGLVLERGENATFAIEGDDEEEIEWTCVGESSSDSEAVDCPDETSHVRVTRAGTGDELLLECYG